MKILKEGDKAPRFKGLDQHGNTVKLSDFKGKKLVIYFYPKDATPGCTVQACNLRDNYKLLLDKGIAILGVSVDSVKSHDKFAKKYDLPFSLLADVDRTMVEAYQVWGPKKFMGISFIGITRTSYLIDENGRIQHIIKKPKTKKHSEEILALSGW